MTAADLQVFDFQGAGIATTVHDGEALLLLPDVCRVLGHSNPSVAKDLVDPADRRKISLRDVLPGRAALNTIAGSNREAWFVTESGFYDLVFESRIPGARAFRRWVTREVLPALRQRGVYAVSEVNRELAEAAASLRRGLDVVLEFDAAHDERAILAGRLSGEDQEASLRRTRALVDLRRLADIPARRFPVDGPVSLPETVTALPLGRKQRQLLDGAVSVDPWEGWETS